jgi:hypothetical protein
MVTTTTTSRAASPGGAFLIEAPRSEEVFTPEELTDDQRLIGRAAEEFVAKEVIPIILNFRGGAPFDQKSMPSTTFFSPPVPS